MIILQRSNLTFYTISIHPTETHDLNTSILGTLGLLVPTKPWFLPSDLWWPCFLLYPWEMLQQSENRFLIDKPHKWLQCHSLHMQGDPSVCPSLVHLKKGMYEPERVKFLGCLYILREPGIWHMPNSVGGRTSRIVGCFPEDISACNSYIFSILFHSKYKRINPTFALARWLGSPSLSPKEIQSGDGPPQSCT